MGLLHAVVGGAEAGGREVWFWAELPEGEASAPIPPRRAGRPRGAAAARPHPFAALGAPASSLVEELAGAVGAPLPGAPAHRAVPLVLPTSNGRPLASWHAAGDAAPGAGVSVSPWLVEVAAPDLASTALALAKLPPPAHVGDPRWKAADLQFLAHGARFALGLLARRRIVPAVTRTAGDGGAAARWQAALAGDEDLARFERLREAMPPSVRMASPDAPAAEVLRSTLDAMVDALARRWLSEAPPPLPAGAGDLPEERWASALSARSPRLLLPLDRVQELEDGLDGWAQELTARSDGDNFRTCFRLEPPRVDPSDKVVPLFDAPAGDWRLRFFLQARDDPSLLVPARGVFASGAGPLRRRGRVFKAPQERLLTDLARAGRLFPPVARALAARRPDACALTLDEAHSFLRDAVPLLSECGFGVLVPPWWGARRPALQAEVEVVPQDAGEARFGLAALVDFNWRVAIGDHALSEEELKRLAALKVPLVRLRGHWVEVRPEEARAALEALRRGPRHTMTLAEALRTAAGAGDRLTLPVRAFRARGWVADLLDNLSAGGRVEDLSAPEELKATLRPYQARGVAWLAFLRRFGLGACLADDMGLGKTVQSLALRLHLQERREAQGPWLLVCPTSVVANWRREAERFAPSMRLAVHHGADRARKGQLARQAAEADLMVTSYALLWRDAPALSAVDWDCIVLDEAQNIKNPLTKAADAARSLRARHRIALTGTPVENRLAELWSIFEFLNPGYLGGLGEFRERFATPIELRGDEEASKALRELVRPFLLRRVKTDKTVIADLPDKVEQKVYCTLTREQATLYQATADDLLRRAAEAEGMQRRAVILAGLTKLKQLLDHPALLLHDRSALAGRSGKLNRLLEMLDEAVAEGDRALIFTQYAEMGGMLKRALEERFGPGIPFLHGGLTVRDREELVRTFQDERGPPAFVLSLKAGGFGLNLTAANRVFHYDRWWNPAVEDQATDRAFRIGQKRNVLVHKFVVAGTLEERIDDLLESKKGLAGRVVGEGEQFLTELSTAKLREMLSLRRDAVEETVPEAPRLAAQARVAARGVG